MITVNNIAPGINKKALKPVIKVEIEIDEEQFLWKKGHSAITEHVGRPIVKELDNYFFKVKNKMNR